jgi:hypothetical protein
VDVDDHALGQSGPIARCYRTVILDIGPYGVRFGSAGVPVPPWNRTATALELH